VFRLELDAMDEGRQYKAENPHLRAIDGLNGRLPGCARTARSGQGLLAGRAWRLRAVDNPGVHTRKGKGISGGCSI